MPHRTTISWIGFEVVATEIKTHPQRLVDAPLRNGNTLPHIFTVTGKSYPPSRLVKTGKYAKAKTPKYKIVDKDREAK